MTASHPREFHSWIDLLITAWKEKCADDVKRGLPDESHVARFAEEELAELRGEGPDATSRS